MHTGDEMGFIPNGGIICKTSTLESSFYKGLNSKIFYDWTRDKLIPNLPTRSIVVVNIVSYKYVFIENVPNSNTAKADMFKWLEEEGIKFMFIVVCLRSIYII